MRIAGHDFVNGRCHCGRRWSDIRDATPDCVGKQGWAHTSYLTADEYSEIEAARAVEVERCWAAVGAVAGAR